MSNGLIFPSREAGILLPGDPEFEETRDMAFPVDFMAAANKLAGECGVICNVDTGLMEVVPWRRFLEYAYDGEYDIREAQMEESIEDEFPYVYEPSR